MRLCETVLVGTALALAALPSPGSVPAVWCLFLIEPPAMSFCAPPRTFRQHLADAHAVVVGRLARPTPPNPSGAEGEAVTDLVIGKILKGPALVAGKGTIPLRGHHPPERVGGETVLIAVGPFRGKFDPYWGRAFRAGSDLPKYVEGILKVSGKKPAERLRFYFDYLQNPEKEIADDALREFVTAEYKDLREAATALPPDKLGAWLTDPKTPAYRVDMYSLLLGHCSKDRAGDFLLLRALAGKSEKQPARDRLFVGLVLLEPKEGWQLVCDILRDPSREIRDRIDTWRAVGFLMDSRPDVIAPNELVKGLTPLLDQPDLADLAIQHLRKWKRWEMTGRVLALHPLAPFNQEGIVRRAIVRFAVCSPTAEAKRFVEEQRRRDPDLVGSVEECLELEEKAKP